MMGRSRTALFDQGQNVRDHDTGNLLHDWHDNAIAELTISLRVAYGNPERVGETHQAGAFTGSQAARSLVITLPYKDFRTIFMVPSRKCAGHAIRVHHTEAKAVACRAVLFRIGLQIGPQVVGQRVFGLYP